MLLVVCRVLCVMYVVLCAGCLTALVVGWRVWFAVCCSSYLVSCVLFLACWLLVGVCCLVFVGCCVLFVSLCVLFAVLHVV